MIPLVHVSPAAPDGFKEIALVAHRRLDPVVAGYRLWEIDRVFNSEGSAAFWNGRFKFPVFPVAELHPGKVEDCRLLWSGIRHSSSRNFIGLPPTMTTVAPAGGAPA